MRIPNIFEFATSELSQDAMFAWLISWADDKFLKVDPELCQLGKKFVSLLTDFPEDTIHSIEVKRQKLHIDLFVRINEKSYLIIEDKVGSTIHDNQLKRYREVIEADYKEKADKVLGAYIKTHNEPQYTLVKVLKEKYKPIDRDSILRVLDTYQGAHQLVADYRTHLRDMTNWTNNRLTWPVKDWRWFEWQGVYMDLEKRLGDGGWSYVPNQSGGFQCYWWHEVRIEDASIKLQFEQEKLCFKIRVPDANRRSESRNRYSRQLINLAHISHTEIQKPHFGKGLHMTIGYVGRDDLFGTGVVDVDAVVGKLHQYEKLVDLLAMQTEVG